MKRTKAPLSSFILFFVALALLISLHALAAFDGFPPIDDPDFLAACKYDAEVTNNQEAGDQSLAEKHYLAFLERCEDSAIRARVYTHLGLLFSTNIILSKGEKSDYRKATQYFEKALEEEPERIGRATVRARLFIASMIENRDERFEARMEMLGWLQKVKDREYLRSHWLPASAEDITPPDDGYMDYLVDFVERGYRTWGYNTAYEAEGTSFPERDLNRVIQTFPDTIAATTAQDLLAKLKKRQSAGVKRDQ